MADIASRHVLTEAAWPASGAGLWVRRAVLLVLGVAALTVAAQVKVPVWPSPVLMSLGTFAVLTIAAAYGLRLGLATMAAWLLIGALGFVLDRVAHYVLTPRRRTRTRVSQQPALDREAVPAGAQDTQYRI